VSVSPSLHMLKRRGESPYGMTVAQWPARSFDDVKVPDDSDSGS
jgi:hypothetical protein